MFETVIIRHRHTRLKSTRGENAGRGEIARERERQKQIHIYTESESGRDIGICWAGRNNRDGYRWALDKNGNRS